VHAERTLAYDLRQGLLYVVLEGHTPEGPRIRQQADGSAICAVFGTPSAFVHSSRFERYTPPPLRLPRFTPQPADVLVIGDHASPRQVCVFEQDTPTEATRAIFATLGRQDMRAAGALAQRWGVPLLAYMDAPGYDPTFVPSISGVHVIPTVQAYPVPLAGGGFASVATRAAQIGAVVDGLHRAGFPEVALVPAAYRQTHGDGTFSWPLQYVLDLFGAIADMGRSRAVRAYVPFCQTRGTDDGMDHIPALASAVAGLRAACTWPLTVTPAPAPAPDPVPVPDPPKDDPMPEPPKPPPSSITIHASAPPPGVAPDDPGWVQLGNQRVWYGADADKVRALQAEEVAAFVPASPSPVPAPATPSSHLRPFGRLRADGPLFRLPDGSPWRWQLASLFELPRVVQLGGDPTPLLDDLESIGANGAIVFAQWWWMDYPAVTPFTATPETLVRCARLLAARRMWTEVVGLCDCEPFGQDRAAQIARTETLVGWLAAEPNVFYRIGNEPKENAVDVWGIVDALDLADPAARPLLMDSGDYYVMDAVDAHRPLRALDYVGDHPQRDAPWANEAAKTGHFDRDGWGPNEQNAGFDGLRAVFLTSEGPKFGPSVDGTGETRVLSCESGAAGFAVDQAGASFHCQSLLRAQRLTDDERAWGQRWNEAMAWIPLDAVTGPYAHDGMAEFPLEPAAKDSIGEIAGHRLGNRWYIVGSNPTGPWVPVAKPGATILERRGTAGQLLEVQV
jgi:hypothetical protein